MEPFVEKGLERIEMGINDFGFHGDVVVTCVGKVPKQWGSWPIIKDSFLAYSEATGHAHKLFEDVEVRENPETKERFFVQKNNVVYLKHQEHCPRAFLGDGKVYKSTIGREYNHISELVKLVAD